MAKLSRLIVPLVCSALVAGSMVAFNWITSPNTARASGNAICLTIKGQTPQCLSGPGDFNVPSQCQGWWPTFQVQNTSEGGLTGYAEYEQNGTYTDFYFNNATMDPSTCAVSFS